MQTVVDQGRITPFRERIAVRNDRGASPSILAAVAEQCAPAVSREVVGLRSGLRCEAGATGPLSALLQETTSEVVILARAATHAGAVAVVMRRKALFTLINLVLGGEAEAPIGRLDRKLTSLDRQVALTLARVLLAEVTVALSRTNVALALSPAELVQDCDVTNLVAPGGSAMAAEFLLRSDDLSLSVLLVIPAALVEPPKRTTKIQNAVSDGSSPKSAPVRGGALPQSPVVVVVEASLEARSLSLADVGDIRAGDTLALVGDSAARVMLECEGIALFAGTAGQRGNDLYVRIDAPVPPGRLPGQGSVNPVVPPGTRSGTQSDGEKSI